MRAWLRLQAECAVQFFVGVWDEGGGYTDDVRVIALRNAASLTGFWFDCMTSIPWSYIDLKFYLVCSRNPERAIGLGLDMEPIKKASAGNGAGDGA